MRIRKQSKWIFPLVYVVCILYITILSRTPSLNHVVRTIPFWLYIDWLKGNWSRGVSILLNVILFVPLGYLLAGQKKSKEAPIYICLVLTIAIEVIQYVWYLGCFDIDDIISNFVGGMTGNLCYRWLGDKLKKWPLPVLALAAGFAGCVLTTGNDQNYETQFDFQVCGIEVEDGSLTLTGICGVYGRNGLEYHIQLQGGKDIYPAQTMVMNDRFTAIVEAPGTERYEVDVVFRGYDPINTKIYINNGAIEYVKNAPEPRVNDTDIEFIIEHGTLMVYNSDYDAYVYQDGDRLYWLIGEDFDAGIIYHLSTDEKERLPKDRQQYGFDNRGFRIGSKKELTEKMNCGKYRVFSDVIPTGYHITAISTGMSKSGDISWVEYFRPLR